MNYTFTSYLTENTLHSCYKAQTVNTDCSKYGALAGALIDARARYPLITDNLIIYCQHYYIILQYSYNKTNEIN
jgi:hypothetical protein